MAQLQNCKLKEKLLKQFESGGKALSKYDAGMFQYQGVGDSVYSYFRFEIDFILQKMLISHDRYLKILVTS